MRWAPCLGVLLGVLLLLGVLPACEEQVQEFTEAAQEHTVLEESDDPVDEPPARPPDFADLVEEVRPAVVNIYTRTRQPVRRPAFAPPGMVPRERVDESLGSGFLFDPSGLVLTNDHVVGSASEIAVRLLDDRIFNARLIGRDPQTDTAVLQLVNVTEDLPTVTLGDSDALRVGNWVIAIGNPLGLSSTVTAGITSATGRQVLPPGGALRFQDFIQTDASINPGNSGGPLINMNAEVVGIATAVSAEGQGLGFAIPINMVQEILPALVEEGRVERSWLGVYVGEVPPGLRRELDLDHGALVTRVVRDGPAHRAGLRQGDVILSIADQEVTDDRRLTWVAANLGVGNVVDVVLQRGHEQLTLPLTMGALPE